MTLNVVAARQHRDPYPFILLNLVLSCIAAVQGPIILMSQKGQEARDRRRAEADYKVNLKVELLLEHLTKEVDTLEALLDQTPTVEKGACDARQDRCHQRSKRSRRC